MRLSASWETGAAAATEREGECVQMSCDCNLYPLTPDSRLPTPDPGLKSDPGTNLNPNHSDPLSSAVSAHLLRVSGGRQRGSTVSNWGGGMKIVIDALVFDGGKSIWSFIYFSNICWVVLFPMIFRGLYLPVKFRQGGYKLALNLSYYLLLLVPKDWMCKLTIIEFLYKKLPLQTKIPTILCTWYIPNLIYEIIWRFYLNIFFLYIIFYFYCCLLLYYYQSTALTPKTIPFLAQQVSAPLNKWKVFFANFSNKARVS